MATELWIELRGSRYDRMLGWHCPALLLPGAKLTAFVLDGKETPPSSLVVSAGQVRFAQEAPALVPDSALQITLEKKLLSVDATIAVALIGLVGTIVSSVLAYETGRDKESAASASARSHAASIDSAISSARSPGESISAAGPVVFARDVTASGNGHAELATLHANDCPCKCK